MRSLNNLFEVMLLPHECFVATFKILTMVGKDRSLLKLATEIVCDFSDFGPGVEKFGFEYFVIIV